jgi:hypothetical protein
MAADEGLERVETGGVAIPRRDPAAKVIALLL